MSVLTVASVLAVPAALGADLVHINAANQGGRVGGLGEGHLLLLLLRQLSQFQSILVNSLLWRSLSLFLSRQLK